MQHTDDTGWIDNHGFFSATQKGDIQILRSRINPVIIRLNRVIRVQKQEFISTEANSRNADWIIKNRILKFFLAQE